jgi:hypothetical protein
VVDFFVFCLGWTVWFGIGTWGLNKTVGWAWDITNFVWWIGIGHAGTLISAILLLFRQRWRTGINRAAEAMTIFAVICAGMFPIFHMGRVWDAFFIFPYPNTRGPLWVNFNSPLLWDVFAISTYFTVSLLFWYSGLMPDFGTIRDQTAKTPGRWIFYNFLSFGWKVQLNNGNVLNHYLWYWLVYLLHLYFRFTLSYLLTSLLQLFRDGIQLSSLHTSLQVRFSPVLPWWKR